MLDRTQIIKPTTNINTPATGIIQKTSTGSFFLRCHHSSTLAAELFTNKPEYKNKPVCVIQVMLISEGYLLIELTNEPPL